MALQRTPHASFNRFSVVSWQKESMCRAVRWCNSSDKENIPKYGDKVTLETKKALPGRRERLLSLLASEVARTQN